MIVRQRLSLAEAEAEAEVETGVKREVKGIPRV